MLIWIYCCDFLSFWFFAIIFLSWCLFNGLFFYLPSSVCELWELFLSSSVCRLSLRILCSADLFLMNSFRLFLSWKVFISQLILKLIFAKNSNHGWQMFSFRVWNISFLPLLYFRVSVENSEVSLVGLLLNVIWLFSCSI